MRSSAPGAGEAGAVAAMTLVWGRPLISGGRIVTAELADLAVDQCELLEERFTLIAPDDYRQRSARDQAVRRQGPGARARVAVCGEEEARRRRTASRRTERESDEARPQARRGLRLRVSLHSAKRLFLLRRRERGGDEDFDADLSRPPRAARTPRAALAQIPSSLPFRFPGASVALDDRLADGRVLRRRPAVPPRCRRQARRGGRGRCGGG